MKYKLIKKFPGSPEIGTIVEKRNDSIYFPKTKETWSSTTSNYFDNIVTNNPEFWEKIVKKNYQILSLARFCTIKPIITDVSDYGDGYIESLLKCDKARIYSVKRLSDGEIFTVGDKIQTSMTLTINKFIIIDNELLIDPFEIIGTVALNKISKSKQPLFTTEDGVDIFEGDEYFELITPNFHNKTCIWNILHNKTRTNINYDQKSNREHGRIWFSTKEKAEEYILMNKPCLSINDLLRKKLDDDTEIFLNFLKKLVKSKL